MNKQLQLQLHEIISKLTISDIDMQIFSNDEMLTNLQPLRFSPLKWKAVVSWATK